MGVGTGLYMTANNTLAIGLLPGNKRGLASAACWRPRANWAIPSAWPSPATLMGAAVADALSGVGTAAGFLVGFQQISLAMAALCGIGLGLSLLRPCRAAPPGHGRRRPSLPWRAADGNRAVAAAGVWDGKPTPRLAAAIAP